MNGEVNLLAPYTWANSTSDDPGNLLSLFSTYEGYPDFLYQPDVASVDDFLLNTSQIVHSGFLFNHIRYDEGKYDVTLMYNQTTDLSLPISLR